MYTHSTLCAAHLHIKPHCWTHSKPHTHLQNYSHTSTKNSEPCRELHSHTFFPSLEQTHAALLIPQASSTHLTQTNALHTKLVPCLTAASTSQTLGSGFVDVDDIVVGCSCAFQARCWCRAKAYNVKVLQMAQRYAIRLIRCHWQLLHSTDGDTVTRRTRRKLTRLWYEQRTILLPAHAALWFAPSSG